MKKIIPLVMVVVVVLGLVYFFKSKKVDDVVVPVQQVGTTVHSAKLCFYGEFKTNRNLSDVSWAKLDMVGGKVTGEFNYLPAEKDKKVGKFTGSVSAVDKIAMARTADVMWTSMAEGMTVTEQLKIVFGEGTAQAGFGEMVDRGDGVYVYKDAKNISLGQIMTDIDCDSLMEKTTVKNINDVSINDKYIHPVKWPPIVKVVDNPFICKVDGSTVQVRIGEADYCVTTKAEGAAGSTYTEYTYAKAYGKKTASINFTIQAVQCMNYDELNKSECTKKQAGYNLEWVAGILLNNLN